jgi:hypothetical protein
MMKEAITWQKQKQKHFISVNRKIKYTIPTPHNFAKVDFTIK